MPTVARTFVIVLVLSGLFVGIGSLRKGQVEGSLTLKSTAALINAVPELRGEPDWQVSFVGTEGIVHGKIGSRDLLEDTTIAIANIQRAEVPGLESVSRLYNGLQFREPARLSISTLSSGNVRVEGVLTADFIEELRPALRAALGDAAGLDDRLQVHRELSSIPWGGALLAFLPEFFKEGNGCRLTIADDCVTLRGVVSDDVRKEQLGALTVSYLDGALSIFDNRLAVVSNRKPAYATVLFVAPDSFHVSGILHSSEAKQAMLSRLAELVPDGSKIDDELQIDQSLAEGDWYQQLIEAAPKLFRYAMTAKIEIEGTKVVATARAISERGQNEIGQKLNALFPAPAYQVTAAVGLAEGGGLRAIAAADEPVRVAPRVPVSMPSRTFSHSEEALRKHVEGTVIYFKINSAMLGTENITTLKKVGKALAASNSSGVLLRGFTDPGGDAKSNQELAAFRCRSVRKILQMHGVNEKRVRIQPWSAALILSNPNEPSWKKRRVEMQLVPLASRPVVGLSEKFELRKPGLSTVPAATAVDSSTAFDELQQIIVYFGMNSFALRRSERSKLRSINSIVSSHPGKDVVISGFCDKWGNSEYNLYLSKKRCETVRAYLIGLGAPSERLVVEEMGNDGATTEEGPSWQKRRVEFRLRDSQQLGVL